MTTGKAIGWIAAVFAGIVIFCLGVLWAEKHFPGKEFDERQQRARGKAGQLGLITGVVYFLATMGILIGQVDGEKKIEPYLLVFFGLMLEIMVMSTYGMLTHSYLSFLQNPIISIVGFGFCGMIQMPAFLSDLRRYGGLCFVGYGTSGWIHLLVGCCFLYISVVLLIQHLRREKE